ncbi:LuxR C-terminal-related transcriptional regulator [Psychrobacter sp. SZ93C1]|uniref:LuxR C-terminal-related transcriptional regulator n=1 Tax=Psychrobacter sp. SZ93C1 TaxID=2792058 RepID=UPI0018CE4422|nr:response regulator transcription factor [Psychrobacter sp. SZ93C1]MBH0064294.1 response regulator transcription factor [Psychrobacter sp. SZ93C1]
METITTVIVADDHPIFLEGFMLLLARVEGLNVVGHATDGDLTLRLIEQYEPDIVLMNVTMSGMSIENIILSVEKQSLITQLIALTTVNDGAKAQQLLNIGLSGYVLKNTAFVDLLAIIKQVRTGKKFISPSLLASLKPITAEINKPQLTNREIDVLTCIVKGDSNKKIACDLGISQRTVCFHMSNCLRKLEVSNRTHAIVQAVNYGLIDIDLKVYDLKNG